MSRIVTQYSWVLGFFGCLGFSGITGDPANLLFFAMFGSFSNLWWAKMSGIDERLIVNRALAGSSVFMWTLLCIFGISIAACFLINDFETLVRVLLSTVALAIAISANVWAWLTHHYEEKGA